MDDFWLRAALSDDHVVAHLLLRLKHSVAASSPPTYSSLLKPLPPSWGLRQPRSKPASTSSLSAPPEKATETRRSPTTPLSWTSEGGCEESSSLNLHHPPSDRTGSKVSAASDTPTTSSKRSKRKKSFAELKEVESSLLKEHTYLKKELATLHATLKEQRSINENLKRIKLDLQVDSGMKSIANSNPKEQNTLLNGTCEASSSSLSRQVKSEDAAEHSGPAKKGGLSQKPVFELPDLNMAPDEECSILWLS